MPRYRPTPSRVIVSAFSDVVVHALRHQVTNSSLLLQSAFFGLAYQRPARVGVAPLIGLWRLFLFLQRPALTGVIGTFDGPVNLL